MVAFYFAKATIDCSTKGSEGVVMTTVQDLFLSELPNGAGFNGSVTFQSRRQGERVISRYPARTTSQ